MFKVPGRHITWTFIIYHVLGMMLGAKDSEQDIVFALLDLTYLM